MEINKLIFKAILVLIYTLAIILIIMLLLKLTNNSPDAVTILSIFIALLTALDILILQFLFQLRGDVSKIEGKLNHLKN